MSQILNIVPELSLDQQKIIKEVFCNMNYDDNTGIDHLLKNWVDDIQQLNPGCFIHGEWITNEFTNVKCGDSASCKINYANVKQLQEVLNSDFSAWKNTKFSERLKIFKNVVAYMEERQSLYSALEGLKSSALLSQNRSISISKLKGLLELISIDSEITPIGTIAMITKPNDFLMPTLCNIVISFLFQNSVILLPSVTSCLPALLFAQLCKISGVSSALTVLPYKDDVDCLKFLHCLADCELSKSSQLKILSNYEMPTLWKQMPLHPELLNIELTSSSSTPLSIFVFEDADLSSAVSNIIDCFLSTLEMKRYCLIFVQDSIKISLHKKLESRLEKLSLKNSDKLITDENCEDTLAYGGKELRDGLYSHSFRTIKEVIDMYNHRKTNGEVYIWTERITSAHEVVHKLKSKEIWVNCQMLVAAEIYSSYLKETSQLHLLYSRFATSQPFQGMTGDIGNFQNYAKDLQDCTTDLKKEKVSSEIYELYYGGSYHKSKEYFPFLNNNGDVLGYLSYAKETDVRAAVESAVSGQKKWAGATISTRSKLLTAIALKLKTQKNEFSNLLKQLGVSDSDSKEEVQMSFDVINSMAFYISNCGKGLIHNDKNKIVIESKEPVGVIVILCPDYKPLYQFCLLLSHAIAFGNSVVIIPSAKYQLIAIKMCQIFKLCNVPSGVVNVITGNSELLVRHAVLHSAIDSVWIPDDNLTRKAFVNYYAVKLNKKKLWAFSPEDFEQKNDKCEDHATYRKTVCFSAGDS